MTCFNRDCHAAGKCVAEPNTGCRASILTGAQPAPAAPSEPICMNFEFEALEPLEGMDRIYAEYAKTFGRYPDEFMGRVVAQAKEDLFTWWGAHRERIRAALVVAEAAAPTAQPADSAMLDWLEEHCTGASDSERYLPFRLYWGKKGHGKSLRDVIQDAMSKERSKPHG